MQYFFYYIVLSIFSINLTGAGRRPPFNGTWIRMGMIVDEMMQNDQGFPSCKALPGLTPGQERLCQLYVDHMNAVALGAKQALSECKYQFHNRRWNCSILDDITVFGPVLTIDGNFGRHINFWEFGRLTLPEHGISMPII